jgi:hypothetical protein
MKIQKLMGRRLSLLLLVQFSGAGAMTEAATIFQSSGGSYLAFEAESTASITNAPPTTWVATNDAPASGGVALYQAGVNGTVSSSSFAYYALKFSTAGTYSFYYRWRADKAYTDLDPNSANSFRVPVDFGDLENDPTSTNFLTAAVNNKVPVPAANSYNVYEDTQTYEVSQDQVDAGVPLIFKIGTREAGMFLDRFVLSTNSGLSESDFNALVNSDTELVVQGSTDGFVAFQAERVAMITNTDPTLWVVTNDATAIGGQALYQAGLNGTTTSSSFAYYSLKFTLAGTYSLYYRWRADKAYTDLDPNSANSFRVPTDFGDLPNDATASNFPTAAVNNKVAVPAANAYNVYEDTQTYTVSQSEVDAGTPLIFKIGTREAGMFIDRFVFSTNSALAEADINALPDSGSRTPPKVLTAVGSATLVEVTITFDKPLADSSTNISNFTFSGGVTPLSATLNTNTFRDISLTTSPQSAGSNYIITINGVTDVTGNQIAPNSTVHFTSWKLAPGWVTRDFYFNVDTNQAGGGVADLVADAKYPNNPNQSDFARGVQINNDVTGNNYGARLLTFFIPPTAGVYEFFVYNDDAAQVWLSSDTTTANLQMLIDSPAIQATFDSSVMGTSSALAAGQQYLLQVLYRQNTGAALLGVAARHQGDSTDPASLPILGGNLISTYVNPDASAVTIVQQPLDVPAGAGSRARFSVKATSLGAELYYQWQVNGVDIPNANRAAYVTPVLSTNDGGKTYQVIVSAGGSTVLSSSAHLTVVPGNPPPIQPYIGVNFVGADTSGAGGVPLGVLLTNDVAGAVLQENWNNITDLTADSIALTDSHGAATPVTISHGTVSATITGTAELDADHVLFQGYIHNANNPVTITLSNIPPATNYSLLVYSVGFNFNATYEEDFDLTGATTYPTLHVRGQDANQYLADPRYIRMSSTDANARDLGNYVQYDNVSPAADGTLNLMVTPASTNLGSTLLPPVNALQLVTVQPSATPVTPSLTFSHNAAANTLTIGWTTDAAGFVVESSLTLGPTAVWALVSGTPNPITTAGSFNANTSASGQQYYRLRK